jgi:hypothetical protein
MKWSIPGNAVFIGGVSCMRVSGSVNNQHSQCALILDRSSIHSSQSRRFRP